MITRVLAFFGNDLARENAALSRENADLKVIVERGSKQLAAADSLLQTERFKVKHLDARILDLQQVIVDAATMAEELTGRLAIAEQDNRDLIAANDNLRAQLAEANLDDQLSLLHSPAAGESVDEGKPDPVLALEEVKPELISDSTPEGVFRVLGVFFIDRRYWLLSRDEGRSSRITAAMHDKSFVARLHKRLVTFTDGDSLRVKLNTKTWRRIDGSLFTQYAITEVLEVLAPPEQLTFDQAAPAAAGASS